ncbi:ApaG domain [Coraliomargarita sp. SDUM461004]|uniref:ApaG domain n=1 Tax=Thalassobacterium sedimentorum TaxID=3041258 RepID=A0ABU1AE29_9BACT|nr:ApaG domain [Coraliomargarita sp. SDUM461004]MDQ8192869.1 ApaG domain [Coraliomargarita sp. SDUM461004]
MPNHSDSLELPGLRASVDRLVYYNDKQQLPSDAPHAFIYFITITNLSSVTVSLCGRRWVLRETSGHQQVIEGEGIVGKEPTLAPGEHFSYNSYHMTHCDCTANGSFHGVDSEGRAIHCRIPEFDMKITPTDES